ncbi:MAG: hypothetical protein J1F35_06030 [Erysipelotrichales bacterium]|nr:hypothetical protein [Erysipelotrichales bacterium]
MRSLIEFCKGSSLSIKEYINEQLNIYEGGNAVTANPIPAFITPLIYQDIEESIKKYNNKIKIVPLGSIGKKKDDDFNGDLDVAIDITDRDQLVSMLEEIWPDNEINKFVTPSIVSMSYPYNKEGKSGNAQVDFMMTKNIDWAKFRYSSPDLKNGESKYKAAAKVLLMRCIIAAIPVKDAKDEYFEDGTTVKKKWKYTFNTEGVFKQLLDYTGKKGPLKNPKRPKEFQELVTNDPENVMKFAFGDKADIKDFNSVEALWKALHTKWQYSKEALGNAEKSFYEDYIFDKNPEVKMDPKDFPCEIYKPEEI